MIRKSVLTALTLLAGLCPPALADETVTRRQVDDRKAVIATVEPVRELRARARIGGTITSLAIREGDAATAKLAINRALTMIPNDPTVLFEAGHVFAFAGEDGKARDYWTRAAAADPNSPSGQAAKRALGMLDVPLTVKDTTGTTPSFDGKKN